MWLDREDLYISPELVTVDYVFVNKSSGDIETLVAFPMPPIPGDYEASIPVHDLESDNFLGFTVVHDGKPVVPQIEQRAVAAGLDVTAALKAQGVPLLPNSGKTTDALLKLAPEVDLELLSDLALADFRGTNPEGDEPLDGDSRLLSWFRQQAHASGVERRPERPVLMGRHLQGFVDPGPEMGRLLEKSYRIQLEEGIKDVEILRKRVLGEDHLSGNPH